MEPAGLQVAFPAEINLGGFAAQGFGPAAVGRIDCAAAVAAELAREAEQHELALAPLRRGVGFMDECLPLLVGDMSLDQLANGVAPLFHLAAPRFLALAAVMLVIAPDEV